MFLPLLCWFDRVDKVQRQTDCYAVNIHYFHITSFEVLAAIENEGDAVLCRKLLKIRKPRKLRKFLTKEVKYRKSLIPSPRRSWCWTRLNSRFDDRVLNLPFP